MAPVATISAAPSAAISAAPSDPPCVVPCAGPAFGPWGGWKEGHIAFLLQAESFCGDQLDLLRAKYLDVGATGHPVIVLRASTTHLIVTPVSAYNAAPQKFLAPWKQSWHRGVLREPNFRGFDGSEQPCPWRADDRPALQLLPGMAMPKPKESWVHVKSVWCVPRSVIGRFHKAKGYLCMEPESLASLKEHMWAVGEEKSKWAEAVAFMDRIEAYRIANAAAAAAAKEEEAAAAALAKAAAPLPGKPSAPVSASSSTDSLVEQVFSAPPSVSTPASTAPQTPQPVPAKAAPAKAASRVAVPATAVAVPAPAPKKTWALVAAKPAPAKAAPAKATPAKAAPTKAAPLVAVPVLAAKPAPPAAKKTATPAAKSAPAPRRRR